MLDCCANGFCFHMEISNNYVGPIPVHVYLRRILVSVSQRRGVGLSNIILIMIYSVATDFLSAELIILLFHGTFLI